jgi:hypothetical protein
MTKFPEAYRTAVKREHLFVAKMKPKEQVLKPTAEECASSARPKTASKSNSKSEKHVDTTKKSIQDLNLESQVDDLHANHYADDFEKPVAIAAV